MLHVGTANPQARDLDAANFFSNKVLYFSISYDLELTAITGSYDQHGTYALPTGPRLRKGFYRVGQNGSVVNEIDDVYWLNATKRIRNDVFERVEARDKVLTYSAVNKELDDSGSTLTITFNFASGQCEVDLQERHYDLLFGTSRSDNVNIFSCDLTKVGRSSNRG